MNKTELLGVCITIVIVALLVFTLTSNRTVTTVVSPTSSDEIAANNARCDKYHLSDTGSSGSATSGKLFKGDKIHTYSGVRKFDKIVDLDKEYKSHKHDFKLGPLKCSKWAVVTTIFEPSDAIRKQALIPDWCLVVVGDKKGPPSFDIEAPLKNYIFLTPAMQESMQAHFPVVATLPWNHFGRKNVGYLYAILHGAQLVWDFDDDNMLISEKHVFSIPGVEAASAGTGELATGKRQFSNSNRTAAGPLSGAKAAKLIASAAAVNSSNTTSDTSSTSAGASVSAGISSANSTTSSTTGTARRLKGKPVAPAASSSSAASTPLVVDASAVYAAQEPGPAYDSLVFNPYPLMLGGDADAHPCWPRGFPLDRIKSNSSTADRPIPLVAATALAADIGIVQSLANHDPDVDAIYRLTQPLPKDFPQRGPTLLVPKGSYSPYNAQATLHTYSALWSLLLPVTIHGRVTDIWRGYAAQRLGMDFGMRVAFSPPVVVHHRNSHNYLADFDSEGPLYSSSLRLVEQLAEWRGQAATLPGRIEELWVELFERGYIGAKDVDLVQAWLASLIAAGYKFPVVVPAKDVVTYSNHRVRRRVV